MLIIHFLFSGILIDLELIPSGHPIHHGTSTMVKQAARNATKKKGAVQKKKTVTKAKQKKEQDHHHASSSSSSPSIRSKFVGVSWFMRIKKWTAQIMIDCKRIRTWATSTTRRRPRASTTSKPPSSTSP